MANYLLNRKTRIIRLIVVLIKKILLYKMNPCFPESNEHFDKNIKVEVDFSNYATKTDSKKQQVLTHPI